MGAPRIDLVGQRFGDLLVLSRHKEPDKEVRWLCLCVCGNKPKMLGYNLRKQKSCGCHRFIPGTSPLITHGHASPLGKVRKSYTVWLLMKRRCLNPNEPGFHNYGGRGITIDKRWLVYENFYADMGDRPADLFLDRINNDIGYSKENCRWATRKEQNRNRRSNKMICHDGKTMCLIAWCENLGIKYTWAARKLRRGSSAEDVLFSPEKRPPQAE